MRQFLKLALIAVLSTAGCAGYQEGSGARTPGEVIDDTAIQASVKSALLGEQGIQGLSINTEVRQGTVRLDGRVASEQQRARVLSLVRGIAGVKGVDDRLVIVP